MKDSDSCKLIGAILAVDGHVVANGEVSLEEPIRRGVFWPRGKITQDSFPDRRTTLKLLDRPGAIALVDFQRCIATLSQFGHYHFGYLPRD